MPFINLLNDGDKQRLVDSVQNAVGSQHRSIGKNTANASRVREYLAGNDAYAQEAASRAGIGSVPPDPNAGDRSGVSDFQRQNHAFMALQGDDLMPAPKSAPSNKGSAKSAKPAQKKSSPVNVEQDEAQNDLRRDKRPMNVAQDEATSPYNRDRTPNNATQQQTTEKTAAPQSDKGEANSVDPWWLAALLGARGFARGRNAAMPDGGHSVPALSRNTSPDAARQGDGIVDAEWTDAHDIEAPRKQIGPPQKLLNGPQAAAPQEEIARSVPMIAQMQGTPESADFDIKDIMNVLGHTFAGDAGGPMPPESHSNVLGEAFARDPGVEDAIAKSLARGASAAKPRMPRRF